MILILSLIINYNIVDVAYILVRIFQCENMLTSLSYNVNSITCFTAVVIFQVFFNQNRSHFLLNRISETMYLLTVRTNLRLNDDPRVLHDSLHDCKELIYKEFSQLL